jgi:hypothetical protein
VARWFVQLEIRRSDRVVRARNQISRKRKAHGFDAAV